MEQHGTGERPERRSGVDRRRKTTNPLHLKWSFRGQRRGGRRKTDDDRFVDKYSNWLSAALIIILVLCVFDGLATLFHLVNGTATELNPIMGYAIQLGPQKFILLKLALTFACLLMLLFHRNARGVRKALLGIMFLYVLLTIYHFFILNETFRTASTVLSWLTCLP
jgi:DMSO/TMAO reductase YedYZ heme-binding membrane subunit